MSRYGQFLAVSLALVLGIGIAGCGSDKPGRSSNVITKFNGPTLTVAARDGSHSDVINAVKGTFESEYNCSVNVVSLSASELHDSILSEAVKETNKYDLVMIDDPLMPEYIEKDVLCNLTQLGYSDDEDFVEKSRLLGKDPYPLGATYALPFSGNVQLIFYNPDLTGETPDLSDWESIRSICLEAQAAGKKGYAVRGQAGNPIVSDFLPILWAFGGDLFDENNNVILDSPESVEALEFYKSLYATGANYDKDGLTAAVTTGEAAMALGWPSWFIAGGSATASIAPIPGKKSSDARALATGEIGNWLLGVTSNSANKDLALKLVQYLTSASVQKEAIKYGGIPTRKSIFKDSSILAEYPYFEQIYSGTNNSRVRPRTTKWSQIEDVFGAELVKCLEEDQDVYTTIENSEAAIKELGNK